MQVVTIQDWYFYVCILSSLNKILQSVIKKFKMHKTSKYLPFLQLQISVSLKTPPPSSLLNDIRPPITICVKLIVLNLVYLFILKQNLLRRWEGWYGRHCKWFNSEKKKINLFLIFLTLRKHWVFVLTVLSQLHQ